MKEMINISPNLINKEEKKIKNLKRNKKSPKSRNVTPFI